MNKTVLISGASIAGPALAYWLRQYGYEPTVVELAPALRGGGQAVDFRGETHFTVLERMGVLPELRKLRTGGSRIRFVDEDGRTRLDLPADFTGGELEVLRGDLARVLYEHSLPGTEYVFGDSVTGLTETATGVRADFRHGAPREFGLVIGADGLHSQVRRLAFGPEESYVSHLGYYAAIWQFPADELGPVRGPAAYNEPGLVAAVGPDARDPELAAAMLLFASPRLEYDRHDAEQHKQILNEAFSGAGWEVPRLLRTLRGTRELYFDSISRADVPTWSKGRIALAGDAACGATVGGGGTGCAVVGAYVLAGELARAQGDFGAAFAAYESRLRPYARVCQQGGDRVGKFFAPRTRAGLRFRNALFSNRLFVKAMIGMGKKVSSTVELPDYASEAAGSGTARH
ncbi:FAD-dependent monooxygenase [Streptomyces winkii]|uniref:FAD-dependent monooxygenase n=1 Tax=Streptomyces winkii TaxID=3051178 RepID=UPI0028D3763E|nr:FAD-dependent monooxygenase [Streptomyces sp. DSM 40971]